MYSAGHADIMKHKKDVGGESMLTLDMVREAQEALRGIARRTPLDRAPKFGENVYIKAENLQLTGAFKLRGAYNKIRSLTPEEAARGVIACSAGNHAQGIALSASRLGIKAVICMPAGAPISKVEATRGYGAEVVLVPGVYDDAAAEAERLTKEQGYTFAHPFNDPLVIAGQGTIGLEILEQLPDVEQIVVPIGRRPHRRHRLCGEAAEAGLPDRGRPGGGRGVHVPVPPRRGPHGAAERVHHCGRHRGEEAR